MAKRLVFFSQMNIVLFLLAFVAVVHRMDSGELREDVRALDLMESVIVATDFDNGLATGGLYSAALTWLQTNDPAIGDKHVAAREQLVQLLQSYGIGDDALATAKGRDYIGAPSVFHLLEIEGLVEIPHSALDLTELSIAEVAALFFALTQEQTLTVAVSLDETTLPALGERQALGMGSVVPPNLAPGTPFQGSDEFPEPGPELVDTDLAFPPVVAAPGLDTLPPAYPPAEFPVDDFPVDDFPVDEFPPEVFPPETFPGAGFPTIGSPGAGAPWGGSTLFLTSVTLRDGIITINLADPQVNSPAQIPLSDLTVTETVQATTADVPGPSVYVLRAGSEADPEVETLRTFPDALDRLVNVYGDMKFGLAEQVLAEEFVRTYQSIDLLGFTISTRRYPFAILLVLLVSSWGIAWTVEAGRQSKRRILTENHEDGPVDSLLNLPLMRAVIWVILPVVAVWAALPIFPLNDQERLFIAGGVVLIALLGLVATVRARAL